MQKGKMKVEGIQTQADADKVLHALNEVWGVREATVNVAMQEAVFSYNEQAASEKDFEQAVIESGFDVSMSRN